VILATITNGAAGDAERFTVYYRDTNPQAVDVAKQLLILIGTLVTSVSSFYFASKTAEAAVASLAKTPPAPVIRSISPTTAARAATIDVKISGDSLDLVKEAKITYGGQTVLAKDLTSNASYVKCTLEVPQNVPQGAWTVTVTDGVGQKADLPGSFTVT
jgi:hypothetical protein